MPDKKYEELKRRLEKPNKSGGNFRSYEAMQQDSAGKKKEKSSSEPSARPRKKVSYHLPEMNASMERLVRLAVPALVAIVLFALAVYALTNKNATEIALDGEVVGQLKTTSLTKEEFVGTLTKKLEELEGTTVKILDEITLETVHGSSKYLMDDSELLNAMAASVDYQVLAAEITVDGQVFGTAKNQAEAQEIFNMVQAPYIIDAANTVAEFVQDVRATDVYVTKDMIIPSDTIRAEFGKTTTANFEYTVVEGDVLSRIAAVNGLTLAELKDLNPDLDVAKPIQIGQKINIVATVPVVSVKTVETKTETVEIPPGETEQVDSSVPSGQRRVVSPGKPGKKEIVTQVTRVNGVKTAEDGVSEKIIEPAQPQVVAVGP